ncbi:MAG TPA: PTS system mannose/fructose/sorbose family transporter subunit IID [Anaerolineae bacterium]|nr:PTS system mannose/fructose/sorbose family transporter subunit IID [Anaerolineae bacterium]HQJ51608.1 PTS system mannose/fructose/sorbose family transporter subunit IID [Anaerolineae bacterium]
MERRKVAGALLLSVVLMLVGGVFSVVRAAPTGQGEAKMSIGIAFVVGVLYYASLSPFFANLGFTVLYRPLVAGTLVGLVMGRPVEGMAIGANINVLYLGWLSAGGSLPGDPGLAGYLGTALALGGGLGADAALAVAAPLGLLGGLTWALRLSTCSIFAHWADQRAEKADIDGVARMNYVPSQIWLFIIYAVPVMLAAYLGSQAVAAALGWVGQNLGWAMGGLYTASGALAALGIALNLRFLFRGSLPAYFFLGFMIAALSGGSINLLSLAIIGTCVALLHVMFTSKGEESLSLFPTGGEKVERFKLLSKNDLFQSWLRWLFFSHSCYNWERMQGMGFAHSMTPIIKKLYKTREDISAALKRHLVFFNTQPDIGGVVHGITIAMEEERAMGADISDDAINSVKTSLMGPMAGIGDTIQQGIVIPIALAIGMSLALQGNILGPVVFLVLMAIFVWGVGWWLWQQGYLQGRSAVTNILKGGALNRVITLAQVLGNFVMGALTVSFVSLATKIKFIIGGTTFELQKVLDSLMPKMLPLLLVLFVWWLLEKKRISPTKIMVGIIVIALLGSYPIRGFSIF